MVQVASCLQGNRLRVTERDRSTRRAFEGGGLEGGSREGTSALAPSPRLRRLGLT